MPRASTALSTAAAGPGLLGSRYSRLASNTIDYWMLPEEPDLDAPTLLRALEAAPVLEDATLQIYLHVPFCAQHCAFCAFSGGNSLNFKEAERYAQLVVLQMRDLLDRCQAKGLPISAVNIGGGSPDLLGASIGPVLRAVRDLPGCSDDTEIGVEFTLSTTKPEFIEALVEHGVTKASFGVQSLDPAVRRHMRQPVSLRHLDQVLGWIDGRIPIVNADLITGMPGQNLRNVASDLRAIMEDERISAVSSYLLTAAAAPALLALVDQGAIPPMPEPEAQALMRLHTYHTLLRNGWVRKGTNTYVNPRRVPEEALARMAGHECIGASHHEAFLLGAGPQAVSSLPGLRLENRVDIEGWCRDMEAGVVPFHLPKCSTVRQQDMALWVFPLRWEGLPRARFNRMLAAGALSVQQLRSLEEFIDEGLIAHTARGFELTILGEVFMGHMVRELKKAAGRQAVDAYISEGEALARSIATGRNRDGNALNNRQLAGSFLREEPD